MKICYMNFKIVQLFFFGPVYMLMDSLFQITLQMEIGRQRTEKELCQIS